MINRVTVGWIGALSSSKSLKSTTIPCISCNVAAREISKRGEAFPNSRRGFIKFLCGFLGHPQELLSYALIGSKTIVV